MSDERSWNDALATDFPELARAAMHPQRLRLVLGNARSGTSWLARMLSQAEGRVRYLNEPINPFKPPVPFGSDIDRTAIGFETALAADHPLLRVYELASSDFEDWLAHTNEPTAVRLDPNPDVVLVKEVHALLATEAVVGHFAVPAVFITREPAYVVDSLLGFRPLEAPMWRTEQAHLIDTPEFFERYGIEGGDAVRQFMRAHRDAPPDRSGVIMGKAVTAAVINRMLERLASESDLVTLVRYEDLVEEPNTVRGIADFLDLRLGERFERFLAESTTRSDSPHPYAVYRDTNSQLERPLKFLTVEERDRVRYALADLGLETR